MCIRDSPDTASLLWQSEAKYCRLRLYEAPGCCCSGTVRCLCAFWCPGVPSRRPRLAVWMFVCGKVTRDEGLEHAPPALLLLVQARVVLSGRLA